MLQKRDFSEHWFSHSEIKSDNITAMSHSAARSAQIQKMRSLLGMPVLQVVQYV